MTENHPLTPLARAIRHLLAQPAARAAMLAAPVAMGAIPHGAEAAFASVTSLQGVTASSVAWGDYDNDGDLDILLTGTDSTNRHTIVYRNDGGNFSSVASLQAVDYSSVAWGDYDNDGKLDILLTGNAGVRVAIVYHNDGSDTFTSVATLQGVSDSSVAWGDYDNDGDLDILLTGFTGSAKVAIVYQNAGANTFTSVATLQGVQFSSVAWGDYDNDGKLDILLTGYDGTSRHAIVYRNAGANTFTSAATLQGVDNSSVAWGDYDNDGDLDILLTGYTGNNSAKYSAIVYQNAGANTFTSVATLTGVTASSVAWGDYDNDGDLDILLTGNGGSNNLHAIAYRNDGTNTFTSAASLQGVSGSAAAWGDYDNDGDLDILLTGTDGTNRHAIIYQNDAAATTANTTPAAPSGLTAAAGETAALLKWEQASDTETTTANGLSYNLCVGTATGLCDVLAPMADTTSGTRRIPARGPVQVYGTGAGQGWLISGLSANTRYYWRVQSVDTGLKASSWSSESTLHTIATAVELTALSATREGERSVITWSTGSETDNAGFHLWRSESTDGHYTRLTTQMLLAQGDASHGADYRFEDTTVAADAYYFYRLEAVDYDGESELHGPVGDHPVLQPSAGETTTSETASDGGGGGATGLMALLLAPLLAWRRRR